ncbi:MAG: cellulase family glycosylhydrolase [Lentisphaeria bacterium]|nr:cellulase family glycosylhydrolase [Lentisphaeria bacterium]
MKRRRLGALCMGFGVFFWGGDLMAQVRADTEGWFPFDMPGLEAASGTAVDFSGLNAEPAGARGGVGIRDGHLADGADQPLRLLGTNLTGDSCFPDPADAPRLARRLRQYGFNVVRLHFMDFNRPGSIWADAGAGTLDPEALSRLDRLIAECAANGIYVNLNLHVAREYPGQPEIPGSRTLRMGKTLDRWYPPYVGMLEEYARALLGRVNGMTGRRYAEEPAIACVEINNENTLIRDIREDYRQLPEPFRGAFGKAWTDWLRARHGTTEALRQAWDSGVVPLGEELLGDRDWTVQNAGGAASALRRDGGVWRWEAVQAGTQSWHLQMQCKGLRLAPGRYTLSMRARSETRNRISHSLMLDRPPWGTVALAGQVDLGPEWQQVMCTGETTAAEEAPLRLNLSLFNLTGIVEFRDFALRPGGGEGLLAGEGLESGVSIPGPRAVPRVMEDFYAFLIETEMGVTRRIATVLRQELGCRMPIVDTQVTYGGLGGLLREWRLSDIVDIHGYWEHPSYTRNERGWVTAFRIPNTTQAAAAGGSVLTHLACHRVRGYPFSVSEYNVPAPNDHGAELFPLLAVMAARQDWDALYSYTYRDFGKDYANTSLRKYFHLIGRANVLVHVPFAVHVFRLRQTAAAEPVLALRVPLDRAAAQLAEGVSLSGLWAAAGMDPAVAWVRRLEVVSRQGGEVSLDGDVPAAGSLAVSADGVISRHPTDPAGAWLSFAGRTARLLVGHVGGRTFEVGDARIEVADRPWSRELPAYACITLTALDNRPPAESRRMLLAASARTENREMAWNGDRTSLEADGWGHGPTLSEAVPLELALPGPPARWMALDAEGRPQGPVRGPSSRLETRVEDRTLWYLIER